MRVALFGVALLAATFLTHVLLWRIRVPRHVFPALFALFAGAVPVACAAAVFIPALGAVAPVGPWEWLHVAIFQIALGLAYMQTYTALQEDSPSLAILLFVWDAGAGGRARAEMYGVIGEEFVIGSRLEALVAGGFLTPAGDRYAITPRGRSCIRTFGMLRWLWRLKVEG